MKLEYFDDARPALHTSALDFSEETSVSLDYFTYPRSSFLPLERKVEYSSPPLLTQINNILASSLAGNPTSPWKYQQHWLSQPKLDGYCLVEDSHGVSYEKAISSSEGQRY